MLYVNVRIFKSDKICLQSINQLYTNTSSTIFSIVNVQMTVYFIQSQFVFLPDYNSIPKSFILGLHKTSETSVQCSYGV